jgi:hypothetical protein
LMAQHHQLLLLLLLLFYYLPFSIALIKSLLPLAAMFKLK